jgi:hypothetical protein
MEFNFRKKKKTFSEFLTINNLVCLQVSKKDSSYICKQESFSKQILNLSIENVNLTQKQEQEETRRKEFNQTINRREI